MTSCQNPMRMQGFSSTTFNIYHSIYLSEGRSCPIMLVCGKKTPMCVTCLTISLPVSLLLLLWYGYKLRQRIGPNVCLFLSSAEVLPREILLSAIREPHLYSRGPKSTPPAPHPEEEFSCSSSTMSLWGLLFCILLLLASFCTAQSAHTSPCHSFLDGFPTRLKTLREKYFLIREYYVSKKKSAGCVGAGAGAGAASCRDLSLPVGEGWWWWLCWCCCCNLSQKQTHWTRVLSVCRKQRTTWNSNS